MKLFLQNEIYPDEKKSCCETKVSQQLFFIFAIGKPIRPPVFYMGYKYPATSFAGVIPVTVICGSGEPW